MKQHLLIVIDNNKKVEPKKYSIEYSKTNKEDFIKNSKKIYENNNQNYDYESYYFIHTV